MAGEPTFLRQTAAGVTVELRVQPRARRTRLACDEGLRAQVNVPAEDGKANAAVIELLAREWRLPRSAFEVLRGAASRQKVVAIAGDPAALAGRIAEWFGEQGNDD